MDKLFRHDVEECLKALGKGGIILYPTDTIWGIGCDATDEKAVERIFRLKKRSDNKAMIVLVSDERDVTRYVVNPDPRIFEYLEQTEKPTTVIYGRAIGLAHNLTGKDGSIAMRICNDEFCQHIIKRFRKPVVSTSANISGFPSPPSFSEIPEEIKTGVDYIVQYRQDDTTVATPSSVIKWNKDGTHIVIRP
jgi:L-threonylcarbamoyladenylate synthase